MRDAHFVFYVCPFIFTYMDIITVCNIFFLLLNNLYFKHLLENKKYVNRRPISKCLMRSMPHTIWKIVGLSSIVCNGHKLS